MAKAEVGDITYRRTPSGLMVGVVTVAGDTELAGQHPHIIYMHLADRDMDPSGVNGRVYPWQAAYELVGVQNLGYATQEDIIIPAPEAAWECPNCGATGGERIDWDNGICQQTGYHDAGTGCTLCAPKVRQGVQP